MWLNLATNFKVLVFMNLADLAIEKIIRNELFGGKKVLLELEDKYEYNSIEVSTREKINKIVGRKIA